MATPALLTPVPPAQLASAGAAASPAVAPVVAVPWLAGALPGGGVRRGTVAAVPGDAGLLLALAAGVADGWFAAVGLPELGLLAASGYGIDPGRLLLVDAPGRHWPEVVAALAGAVEVILLRPAGPVAPQLAARLGAVLRRTGCVLVVAGEWPGAEVRLGVRESRWVGLGDGHGLLAGRRAEVTVTGRGAAARGHTVRLWLPDEHGAVRALTPAEEAGRDEEAAREGAAGREGAAAYAAAQVYAEGGALAPAAVGVGSGEEPEDAVGRGRLTAV